MELEFIKNLFRLTPKKAESLKTQIDPVEESKKNIEQKVLSFAKYLSIQEELDEQGHPSKSMKDRLIQKLTEEGEDYITLNEIRYGVRNDFWKDDQWAKTFEDCLGNRSERETISGFNKIVSRPGTIIKLLELQTRSPELLSESLNNMTSNLIKRSEQGELGEIGKIVRGVLPEIRKANIKT